MPLLKSEQNTKDLRFFNEGFVITTKKENAPLNENLLYKEVLKIQM